MKVSALKENIRGIVRKKMEEAVIIQQTGAPLTDPQLSQKIKTLRAKEGDPTIGTEKNVVRYVREAGEYTMDKIYKMTRAELIDFTGLTPQDAAKYSTRTTTPLYPSLQSIALEMADDRPADEEPIDEEDFMDDDDNTIMYSINDNVVDTDDLAAFTQEDMKTPLWLGYIPEW